MSTIYAGDLSLSNTEASMLVATPILVGALGRIVIGSLTDRFGGRTMFIVVSVASIGPGSAAAASMAMMAPGAWRPTLSRRAEPGGTTG
jgi:NNP family nitrate/nitrite transporter-like MFS transporter